MKEVRYTWWPGGFLDAGKLLSESLHLYPDVDGAKSKTQTSSNKMNWGDCGLLKITHHAAINALFTILDNVQMFPEKNHIKPYTKSTDQSKS